MATAGCGWQSLPALPKWVVQRISAVADQARIQPRYTDAMHCENSRRGQCVDYTVEYIREQRVH